MVPQSHMLEMITNPLSIHHASNNGSGLEALSHALFGMVVDHRGIVLETPMDADMTQFSGTIRGADVLGGCPVGCT